MSAPENENNQPGEMGAGAAEYSSLESAAEKAEDLAPAADFYKELADKARADGQSEWAGLLDRRASGVHDRLVPKEFPEAEGSWKRPATEEEARDEIAMAAKLAGQFLGSSKEDRSATLVDLNLGNEFDAAIGVELMTLLGAHGRKVGEAVPEWDNRFETNTYQTDLAGIVLKRWRHHPSGSKTDTSADFEKFYLAREK